MKKLADYKIQTLNIPSEEHITGAKWLLLPFISGFDATTEAQPIMPPASSIPPGEYYLIPVEDFEHLDLASEFVADDYEMPPVDESSTPF